MATKTSVDIPIQINLTQDAFDKLSAGVKDQSVATALANKATVMFDNLANGGMMLTPDQVQKIEKAIGSSISRGADVVSAVQTANNIEEDAKVRKLRIDPIWDVPLEAKAQETGRSVDQLISDTIEIAFEGNWIYGFIPANGPVFFRDADLRYWQQATGEQKPTGADITKAAQKQVEVAA